MGECAEMMLDGTCCQCCGEFLGDSGGFPVFCSSCKPDRTNHDNRVTTKSGIPIDRPSKVNCPTCNKLVKKAGLKDHNRVVHNL